MDADFNNLLQAIWCKYDTNRHLYDDPVNLPCNQPICSKCLLNVKNKDNAKKRQFTCLNCKQMHEINDKMFQNKNKSLTKAINENLEKIYNSSLSQLTNQLDSIESKLSLIL